MNILIIEDDDTFARHLIGALERQSIVNRVSRISGASEFYQERTLLGQYDIILLDLTLAHDALGHPSGLKILSSIRESCATIPVIIISASEKIDLMERALSMGASDYITKNIRLSEIKLRVMHWFRLYCHGTLHLQSGNSSYHGLSYHTEQGIFEYNGTEVELSRGNRYILSLFLMHPEKTLGEKYLTEKIWGDYDPTEDRTIRVTIARLRKALEPYGLDSWIESRYGEGYALQKPRTL